MKLIGDLPKSPRLFITELRPQSDVLIINSERLLSWYTSPLVRKIACTLDILLPRPNLSIWQLYAIQFYIYVCINIHLKEKENIIYSHQ